MTNSIFWKSILEKTTNIEASLSEFKPVHIRALVEIVDEVLQKLLAA